PNSGLSGVPSPEKPEG
ncbi:hypothetical protein A2U01_0047769, partial [Trifolium medium]|nr:hypothetical protein [Trifolium medium]